MNESPCGVKKIQMHVARLAHRPTKRGDAFLDTAFSVIISYIFMESGFEATF